MTAIWLLSTRGRPDACQEVLDACEATGMTSPGVVYVDETVDEYRNLRLPKNWTIRLEPEWGSLQASMQWCFRTYPDATGFGWLADDTYPRTEGWDKRVEAAAGDWNLAYCNDLWMSLSGGTETEHLYKGMNLSSGLCWGGELVRTVGWWALPGVVQAGIDTAWLDIIYPFGLHRYLDDVVVEHKNWRTGKRPYDDVDRWEKPGHGVYINRDIEAKERWTGSPEFRNILRRLAEVLPTGWSETLVARAIAESGLRTPTGGILSTQQARRVERMDGSALQHLLAYEGSSGNVEGRGGVLSRADLRKL